MYSAINVIKNSYIQLTSEKCALRTYYDITLSPQSQEIRVASLLLFSHDEGAMYVIIFNILSFFKFFVLVLTGLIKLSLVYSKPSTCFMVNSNHLLKVLMFAV